MASRTFTADPLHERPFWQTRSFVLLLVGAGIVAVVIATTWLGKVNQRVQATRRLADDPRLSSLMIDMKTVVEKNVSTGTALGTRAPVALWLGRVAEFFESQPTDGSSPAAILKLQDADLLAGERSKMDRTALLTISARQYTFAGPQPVAGETWLVSVWRDTENRSVIHGAHRTSPQ